MWRITLNGRPEGMFRDENLAQTGRDGGQGDQCLDIIVQIGHRILDHENKQLYWEAVEFRTSPFIQVS